RPLGAGRGRGHCEEWPGSLHPRRVLAIAHRAWRRDRGRGCRRFPLFRGGRLRQGGHRGRGVVASRRFAFWRAWFDGSRARVPPGSGTGARSACAGARGGTCCRVRGARRRGVRGGPRDALGLAHAAMSGADRPFNEVRKAAELAPDDPLSILDSPTAGGRVIRGGMMRLGTYAAGVALGIASAALMTRYLGVEDFGRYVIVTSLVAMVAGLTEAGVPNIAAREFATRDRRERNRLIANLFGILLSVAVIGVLAAAGFAIVVGYDRTMVAGTIVAGVGLVIATVQQTYAIPIGVALRFGWLSALDLLRQAAFVAIVVVLLLADAGLLPLFAATIPASLFTLAVSIPLVRGHAPLLPRFERAEWLRIVRLVGVYAAAAAVGTIYVSAVVIVTSLVGTAADAGYLGAAFRIFTVLALIPLILVSTAFPVLARAAHTDRERMQYAVQRLVDIALILGTWMAL